MDEVREMDREAGEARRLLDGAARSIAKVRNCWLMTRAETGGLNVRPVERMRPDPGEDVWTIRFLTGGGSQKIADIRRDAGVTMVFQYDPNDAFVALSGKAELHGEPAEVRRRWKDAYNNVFPDEASRANAVFVEVHPERL